MGHDASHFTPVVMHHSLSPATPQNCGVDPAAIALADGVCVLWQDQHMALVLKPSGMLSVPGRGPDKQDCLSARLAQAGLPSMVVHRLDQATSGLMLFARGPVAQRALSLAFAERRITKRYVAIVNGHMATPAPDWGVIDLPIGADWHHRPLRKIDHLHGKASVTRWRVLAAGADQRATRLELEPETGRSHQLRVHLLALGHPILGDALYGTGGAGGLHLLARAIALPLEPPLQAEAPPPPHMEGALRAAGWQGA
jgi:tRNA pseudouridine32 synthase/23S rRNA pseudouridine746 synthase